MKKKMSTNSFSRGVQICIICFCVNNFDQSSGVHFDVSKVMQEFCVIELNFHYG